MASPDTAVAEETTEPTGEASDVWASTVAFNEALAAARWDEAAALAAPGSPAQAYIAYRTQVDEAQTAAGLDPAATGEVVADEAAGTVSVTVEGDSGVTYVWSDFETEDGLVSGWSTEQGPLADLITSPGSSAEAAGAVVTLPNAYVTSGGELYVVVGISAVDDTIAVDATATLRLPDGTTSESGAMVGPDEVAPGGSAYVLYPFAANDLDGVLVYEVQNTNDAPVAVELPLR